MIVLEFDGEYAHAFTNLAGGPYDTRQEALNRKNNSSRKAPVQRHHDVCCLASA